MNIERFDSILVIGVEDSFEGHMVYYAKEKKSKTHNNQRDG
jgi:hypothetical protein